MLYTIVDFNDVFTENRLDNPSPRSTNPYDYIRTGYYLDNAKYFGGHNNVNYNLDISGNIPSNLPYIPNK